MGEIGSWWVFLNDCSCTGTAGWLAELHLTVDAGGLVRSCGWNGVRHRGTRFSHDGDLINGSFFFLRVRLLFFSFRV